MVRDDLPKCEANYAPLTPITFIQRAAAVFPDRLSVIYGHQRFTWAQTLERSLRIASALASHGITRGDTVVNPGPSFELFFIFCPLFSATMKTYFRLLIITRNCRGRVHTDRSADCQFGEK